MQSHTPLAWIPGSAPVSTIHCFQVCDGIYWLVYLTLSLFVCLFIATRALTAVTITCDRAANSGLCLVLMAFRGEGSFMCHTYCDTGPRSYPKDQHQHPTVGFDPSTRGSLDLCAAALTTAPHKRLFQLHSKACWFAVTIQVGVLRRHQYNVGPALHWWRL
jgi:hypothetical protein